MKVFNDTRYDDPIEMTWAFTVARQGWWTRASRRSTLKPGTAEETGIEFTAPRPSRSGRPAELTLTCRRSGKEVFREVKQYHVIDADGAAKPELTNEELVVIDPKGSVKARLTKRGIAFTEAASPDALPARMQVLVVGPDALTPRQATDPMWQALAADGVRVLVLDQDEPAALPGRARRPRSHRPRRPRRLPGKPDTSDLQGTGARKTSSPGRAITSFTATSTRRRRAAPGRCSSATTTYPAPRSPSAASRTASCCSARRWSAASSTLTPWRSGCSTTCLNYCAAYKPAAKETVVVLDKNDLRMKLLDASGLKHDDGGRRAGGGFRAARGNRGGRRLAGEPQEAGGQRWTR